jgi:hypothetical protein
MPYKPLLTTPLCFQLLTVNLQPQTPPFLRTLRVKSFDIRRTETQIFA